MFGICSHTTYSMLVGKLIGLLSSKQARLMYFSGVCVALCDIAFKRQTYKELNLYLRRYNTVIVSSFLNQARPHLLRLSAAAGLYMGEHGASQGQHGLLFCNKSVV